MVPGLPDELFTREKKRANRLTSRNLTVTHIETTAVLPLHSVEVAEVVAVVAHDCTALADVGITCDVAVIALIHRLLNLVSK